MSRTHFDLEDRLIAFAISILETGERLPKSHGAQTLARQLMKSGTAPALNYAEAQAAESGRDFLHKMRVCLKELRESQVCLKIIARKPFLPPAVVDPVLNKCSELVAIFMTSIQTKERNMLRKKSGMKG